MFCFFLTATRQSDFLLLGLRLHSRGGLKRDFSLMCNSFEKECKKKDDYDKYVCVKWHRLLSEGQRLLIPL